MAALTMNPLALFRRGRILTPGEKAELEAERKAAAHMKTQRAVLQREARHYANTITRTLEDLNICYRYKRSEKDLDAMGSRVKRVSFKKPFVLREEAIYLEVDLGPGKRPRGVGVDDLADPGVLRNLGINCGHKVLAKYTEEAGFFYIVEREYGVRGIPSHVKYNDIITARPASADSLSLPVGIGENKKPIFRSLGQLYSMGVFGTIGGGKSNIINAFICSLLRFNSPKRLRVLPVDLKGGVEFAFFQGIPHLLNLPTGDKDADGKSIYAPTIIERREQVPKALDWLITEGERRQGLLKESHAKHIGKFNWQNKKNPLAHILLVIDEWGDVKLDPAVGKESEEKLINIASRFRNVGIHVILCTQTPTKEVVTLRVKQALPSRLVFACPDMHASILCVGNSDAYGLEPAGRGIFIWGKLRLEVQTPFINDATVDDTVAQAVAGHFNDVETTTHDVSDQEILEWAVIENAGDLNYLGVFNHFRLRGLSKEVAREICASYENQLVVVESTTYRVMPQAGNRGRRLLPVENEPDYEANDGDTILQ